jgi:DNA polymerase III delta subunit
MYKEVSEILSPLKKQSTFGLFMFNDENNFFRDLVLSELSKTRKLVYSLNLSDCLYEGVKLALKSKSLIAEKKMIVLRYSLKDIGKKVSIKENGKKKKVTTESMLESLFSEMFSARTDCLVFLIPNKFDKKNTDKFKQKKLIEFKKLNDKLLKSFIVETVESNDGSIDSKAVSKLMSLVHPDLYLYENELKKLIVYDSHITSKSVSELVSKTNEVVVFDLVESIVNKNEKKSMRLLSEAVEQQNFSMFQFLSIMIRNFRYIHYILIYKAESEKIINVTPFIFKKYVEYSKRFNKKRIRSIIESLLIAQMDLKTNADDKLVIFNLLMKIM